MLPTGQLQNRNDAMFLHVKPEAGRHECRGVSGKMGGEKKNNVSEISEGMDVR